MENKLYTDQSTVFDHRDVRSEMYRSNDQDSQTLKMKKLVTTAAVDTVLILFILIISFYII